VVPVVGLAGAWGISKIKKTKKERIIKAATGECMSRNGFAVDDWRVMSRREVRAMDAVKARHNSAEAVVAALPEPQ
jgi:hypothetical protein